MFSTTHFHSNTHELLVVFRWNAQLLFGGGENPARVEVTVSKGDAILVPAGVGHKLLNQGTEDFEMVGSYPKGADKWDICYGKRGEDVDGKIRNLGWFERDPLYGENGPARSALGG